MPAPDPMLVYLTLRERFGHLDWWPGDSPFEILVGALLTQQTTWKNVEKAIANLKHADALSLESIADMPLGRLEKLIMPSGYYRQKARRLKELCTAIRKDHGSLGNLFRMRKEKLREVLLSYNGIGKETADSIILYAANKPIFVIDAYTKRIMNRVDPRISREATYDQLQDHFESKIERSAALYNDFHAQFVELGKNYCRAKPLCRECPLNSFCDFGRSQERR